MHQARKARHGSVDGISPKRVGSPGDSLMRRLLLGVDDDSDCWLWGRAKSDSGYGHLLHLGRQRGVHVWMWEAYHGRPVPPGMQVCHSCDVRACLNPNHLWLGSAADNAADMREKRRQARGSRHSQALLTEEQVLAIRADHRNRREVAADYGISPHTVYCIRTRLSWQWLGDDGEAIA
jgi:DNA-binding CsgD family transcriptional regulator